MFKRTFIIAIFLVVTQCAPLLSSNTDGFTLSKIQNDSLRVGLVLSGGGAKGIAHIGVLKKLEEAGVRIDYITGTSMGSLIGALYSIGYTTTQLTEIAKTSNWNELFTEKPSRLFLSNYERRFENRTIASFPIREKGLELPVGIINGQNIYSFLSRYTWPVHGTKDFNDFPIPYAAVGTELETGNAKIFRSGYLPDAIRASISIPSLLRPHPVDGVTYIDGGLSNNLPVDEAHRMGADFVISVNVSSHLFPEDSLRTFAEVLNQVINYRINEKIETHIEASDIYVNPLDVHNYDILDFNKVDELIKIGSDEADKYMDEFKSLASRQSSPPPIRRGIGELGSLPLNKIIIEGNELVSDEFIESELQISEGFLLTPDFIEDKIIELYSTQLFDLITYRIQPDESYYYNLHINVVENRTDIFRVGFRYESKTNASILLASRFQNFPFSGIASRFDLRLGDEVRALADILTYGRLGSRIGFLTSFLYESENVDLFVNGERSARFTNRLGRLELSAGNYLSTNYLIALGGRQDFVDQTNIIRQDLISVSAASHRSYFLRFIRDQLSRTDYPTEGSRLVLNSTYSGELTLSDSDYFSAGGLFESYLTLTQDITFKTVLHGGYSSGEELPWSSWFSLNRTDPVFGFVRFGGIERYEFNARNLQMASLGLQLEPFYHRFINLDYYAGRFLDEWTLSTDYIIHGGSITVGALTILGPIQLILSASTENSFLAEFQIGYQF